MDTSEDHHVSPAASGTAAAASGSAAQPQAATATAHPEDEHEKRMKKALKSGESYKEKENTISVYLSYFRPFINKDPSGKASTHICELCYSRLRLHGAAATSNAKTHLSKVHSTLGDLDSLKPYGAKPSLSTLLDKFFTPASTEGNGDLSLKDKYKTQARRATKKQKALLRSKLRILNISHLLPYSFVAQQSPCLVSGSLIQTACCDGLPSVLLPL